MTRPKFKVGHKVTYRGDRRLRRVIKDRYWDANYPSWRYCFEEFGLRGNLASCWAVIESELLAIPARRGQRGAATCRRRGNHDLHSN
jgi:hypothetical protein